MYRLSGTREHQRSKCYKGSRKERKTVTMVDHDQERVKARGGGKISDEVAGQLLEWTRGRGANGVKGGYCGMCIGLGLLTISASLDVFSYELGKAGPPVVSCHELAGSSAMWAARVQSIIQTNIASGSWVTSELSLAVSGQRSGRRDRASGPMREVPGTWVNLRSKSARSTSQQACRRLRC